MAKSLGTYLYNGYGCRIRIEAEIFEKKTKRGIQLFYVHKNGCEVLVSHDEFKNGGWFRMWPEEESEKQLELFR